MKAAAEIPHMLDYELLAYYRSFQILAALETPNGNLLPPTRNPIAW